MCPAAMSLHDARFRRLAPPSNGALCHRPALPLFLGPHRIGFIGEWSLAQLA